MWRSPLARPSLLAIAAVALLSIPGAVAPAARALPEFGAPVVVDATRTGPEPSLLAAPDGSLYVAAPCGLDNTACKSGRLWRSDDGGASFGYQEPSWPAVSELRGASAGSGDSEIALTASGRLVYADLWVGGISVSTSDDRGATWMTSDPLGGTLVGLDRQWLATDGDIIYMAYQQVDSGLYVVKSLDGGLTFPFVSLAVPRVSSDGQWRVGIEGDLVVGPDHALYLVYPQATVPSAAGGISPGRVMVAKSADGGATWSQLVAAERPRNVTRFPQIAIDSMGGIYVAWSEPRAGATGNDVWVAASTDGGATWGAPMQASPTGVGSAEYPWIAAGAPGKIAVGYYGTDDPLAWRDSSGLDNATWYARLSTSYDALDPAPHWATATPDPAPVHVGAMQRALFDFVTVRVDRDGALVFAYTKDVGTGIDAGYGALATDVPTHGRISNVALTPPKFVKQAGGPGFR